MEELTARVERLEKIITILQDDIVESRRKLQSQIDSLERMQGNI